MEGWAVRLTFDDPDRRAQSGGGGPGVSAPAPLPARRMHRFRSVRAALRRGPLLLPLALLSISLPLRAQTPPKRVPPVLSQVRPPAPASVTATETEPGVITVEWAEVPGAKDYYLFKETRPNGAKFVGFMTGTKYVDRSVKNGVTYSYGVTARSQAGVRGWPAR